MQLNLENIVITGRTFEEYSAFFDLSIDNLKGKKVLDCPSGASSFVATLNKNYIQAQGVDVIYEFDKKVLGQQGVKSIEKVYEDTSWMDVYKMDFYKTKENHRLHRESALKAFIDDYNSQDYIFAKLPNLPFEDDSFDLLVSSHLLFVYDDRLDFNFHKDSIVEMLRVAREVRIFPLVDFKNSRVHEAENFSPFVSKILKEFQCEIIKTDFEFQPRADCYLKISR